MIKRNSHDFGVYEVSLYSVGRPITVIVDDWFPCDQNGSPVFTKANGAEMWVLILEKAFAKLFGSYAKTEYGYPDDTLRDLTGAPGYY